MKRLAFALLVLSACNKETPTTEAPAAESEGLPPGNTGPEATISAGECESRGGVVVGDIGDGAIFRPDYTCEGGEAPVARIAAEEGEPMGVEGSVCCDIAR